MKRIIALALALTIGPAFVLAEQPKTEVAAPSTTPKSETVAPMKEMAGKKMEGKRMHGKKMEGKKSASRVMGAVETLDAATGKLTVKDKKGEVKEFTVGSEAKVMKAGKPIALSEIAVGENVVVAYAEEAGAPVVKSVMVRSPKMMKGKKK